MTYFIHRHPYAPFLFPEATKLIVGTLPPPRFTTGALREGDVNFCYGSRDGQLWPILDRIYELGLSYEGTDRAIEERKNFLKLRAIGICDIVASAKRDKVNASDLGMEQVVIRNVLEVLKAYPRIDTILFTGGNSKNGPEYFFRKLLKVYGLVLEEVSSVVPRIYRFQLPPKLAVNLPDKQLKIAPMDLEPHPENLHTPGSRLVHTVSLTAPSGAANRAVGSLLAYKELKKQNPEINTIDFRALQYAEYF